MLAKPTCAALLVAEPGYSGSPGGQQRRERRRSPMLGLIQKDVCRFSWMANSTADYRRRGARAE
jgi:hypothetical protein